MRIKATLSASSLRPLPAIVAEPSVDCVGIQARHAPQHDPARDGVGHDLAGLGRPPLRLRGERRRGLRQQDYEWAYLFDAVRPATGVGFALVLPKVSTAATEG